MTDKLTAARLGELLAGATKGEWGQNKYGGIGAGEFFKDPPIIESCGLEDAKQPDIELIVALVNAAEQIRGLLEREEAKTAPVGDWSNCLKYPEDRNLTVDGIVVGWVTPEDSGWTAHADDLLIDYNRIHSTEAEARAAVEDAVRGGR